VLSEFLLRPGDQGLDDLDGPEIVQDDTIADDISPFKKSGVRLSALIAGDEDHIGCAEVDAEMAGGSP